MTLTFYSEVLLYGLCVFPVRPIVSPHWTGPTAALYQSFDDSDGLVMMEGTAPGDSVPLVCGQVN